MIIPKKVKKDEIAWWKAILKVVPKRTKFEVLDLMEENAAFCNEMRERDQWASGRDLCSPCPIWKAPCMSPRWHDFLAQIGSARYWRKIAVEFCEEVIKELKLVEAK